jgi:hypothetical protein
MTVRKKRWLYAVAGVSVVTIAGLAIAASVLSRRFEPFIREQAIAYMSERFNCDVELAALRIKMPKLSPLNVLLKHGRGAMAHVEGQGIAMRYKGAPADAPPLFRIRDFSLKVDLGTLFDEHKTVDEVVLNGMEINVPPKGERQPLRPASETAEQPGSTPSVLLSKVVLKDAKLTILPKDRSKKPLEFEMDRVTLRSSGPGRPMRYEAALTNPKPKGKIQSSGTFGPWVAEDPSATPLAGDYTFADADLSIFKSIAGILQSTGSFEGVLSSLKARGEARVPDFRLAMANNPVPLYTKFEVQVDGTNGNTVLQPVQATLGSTRFRTSGAVIKHEGDKRRSIDLQVDMPGGNLRDVLRLAMKGQPFMEGKLYLKTSLSLPPLSSKVREKLRLNGQFRISEGKFLKSTIQDQIDKLSRKGQGSPTSEEIDEVVSGMNGSFHLENERITFRKLAFEVPGAKVDLAGNFDMDSDALDFLGTLKLQARVSQTMTGWKRIALKPVDPFFAKEGAGTFLRIAVDGTSRKPNFGLARGKKKEPAEAERARAR